MCVGVSVSVFVCVSLCVSVTERKYCVGVVVCVHLCVGVGRCVVITNKTIHHAIDQMYGLYNRGGLT